MKTVIVGAGLGGLTTGIMLKKARPNDEVVIYDLNKHAGGFCNAFEKVAVHNDERIKYTVNIPLITGDFSKGAAFDKLMEYMGVKNIDWRIVTNFFEYTSEDGKNFKFTKNGPKDIIALAQDEKEAESLKKYFKQIAKFYNDLMHKAHLPPTFFQALKMLFTMPDTVFKLLMDEPYLKALEKIGIKTQMIKDIFCVPEAFMGVDVDKVSAMGEMCMIQSFLQEHSVQPAEGFSFQTLADNFAKRFIELGGILKLNTRVDSVEFDKNKAIGVTINNELISADNVILSVAQDVIKPLIEKGKHIGKVKNLINKIDSLRNPNSDYYCYYLIDKKTVDDNPKLTEFAYHLYKLPKGRHSTNWKVALWVPPHLYNDKYYILEMVMTEQSQEKINWWMDLRKNDYKKYTEEKEKIGKEFLEIIQEVEPIFKKNPPIKQILGYTPASYIQYGSKYPICGIAQTPENYGMRRMTPKILNNLYLSSGAVFAGGLWGAVAGGWQGFVTFYKDVFGIEIGNRDVLYKPGLKNLP
ncbi:MAG TPA: FAD-dependent oxidoreductase [Spirochaetota bacterium]|nr:FAD-dependent oxidoreductase [Spirochaetota bacterium]